MGRVATGEQSVKRLLSSWVAIAVILLMLCAAAGLVLQQLQRQVQDRAQHGAIATAEIVAALVAHRNIDAADFTTGILTASERADMDADVAELFRQSRIVGLEVWHADGQLMYADKRHPDTEVRLPGAELAQSRLGVPWVKTSPTSVRGVLTLDVLLPYDAGTDGVHDGVVEVLLPDVPIATAVRGSTRELDGLALVVVLTAIGSLLLLRRRLLAREHEAGHDPLTGLLNRSALRDRIRAIRVRATAGRRSVGGDDGAGPRRVQGRQRHPRPPGR